MAEETTVVDTGEAVTEVVETANPEPYDWHTDIHPDVKDDPIWKSTPDVKTLTKAYADATRYNVGAIKMPGKDATPEEIGAFHAKLGRPASPEAYDLGDRFKDDPTAIGMRAVAHSAGLTQKQWSDVISGYGRLQDEQNDMHTAARDTTVKALHEEYGAAFDHNVGLVQRMIRTYGGEETWEQLSTNPIGNDAGFVKMMVTIAKAMAEEQLIDGTMEGEMGRAVSKDEMLKEVDDLMNSRVYLRDTEPGHEAAVARAAALLQRIYN